MPIIWIVALVIILAVIIAEKFVLRSSISNTQKTVITIVLGVGLVVTCYLCFKPFFEEDDDNPDVKYLNESIDLSLLIYGDDIEMPEGLEYKKIDSIDDESIFLDNDYVYLIIIDITGDVSYTEGDFNRMIEYADKHTNFNFFYLGEDKLSMIEANYTDANIDEGDMDFGYVLDEGERLLVGGMWNKDEEQYLEKKGTLVIGENIVTIVSMEIKTNE